MGSGTVRQGRRFRLSRGRGPERQLRLLPTLLPVTHRPLASRLFTILAPRAPSSISVVLSWLLILGGEEGSVGTAREADSCPAHRAQTLDKGGGRGRDLHCTVQRSEGVSFQVRKWAVFK